MTDEELRDLAVAELESTTISYPTWRKRVDEGYKGKPYDPAKTSWGRAFAALEQIGAALPQNRYTDIDFAGGKYAGQGVYAIFEAYQSDPRLSDWGGTDAPLYDQWGMSTDRSQRVHLRTLFGRLASWQELRSSDGPWASNAPTLAKSTLNITREATWGPGGYSVGAERWWAVDYLFPLDVDGASFEFVSTWHSLFGLHPATSSQGGTLDSFIRPENGNPRWHMLGTTPNPQTTPYREINLDRLTNADGSRNVAAHNVWHELVIGMKAAPDNSGWLEVWHDGRNVLSRENRPTVLPGETGPYAQLQNYTRHPTSFVGGKTRGVMVYGGFRAGLSRSDVQT